MKRIHDNSPPRLWIFSGNVKYIITVSIAFEFEENYVKKIKIMESSNDLTKVNSY